MTHVVIVVPGIMGSVLELNGEVIWPGPVSSLFLPYNKMAELMNPDLVATDLIRKFSISVQYQSLLDDLARCGFVENPQPTRKKTLFVCPYDWRKDNALSAAKLADMIDEACQINGAGTEVSLIGHSMGGLVCRYYLESGDFAQKRPGFSSVRRLITLATPHRGAPLALSASLGKEKRLFLNADQVKMLVNDTRYTAVYQLMPPPGEPFAWNEDKQSMFGQVDIYDQSIAASLPLVAENLEAARTFHSKLNVNNRPQYDGQMIRYFFFVGTRQKTPSAANLLNLQTTPATYRVRVSEWEDAGDGTVPAWSGTLTGIQGQPVGGEHSTIYRSDELRRTLCILLGAPGVLAAIPMTPVEVSLRERVVNPGGAPAPAQDRVHVALTFPGVNKIDGKLVVQRAVVDDHGVVTYDQPTSVSPISYSGLNAEKLNVVFTAPSFPGLYRVAYFPVGYDIPAGSDELIVQES